MDALVAEASSLGDVHGVIHAAGVSPSQASPQTILKVDLYGTALVLEEFGKVIAEGGAGIVIASQSGHMIHGCPAKRAGTPDEVGNVAALLMGAEGAFITGSEGRADRPARCGLSADFLMDGGVTSSYWFGELASK